MKITAWKGKALEECTKEDLREIVSWLVDAHNLIRDNQIAVLETELNRVKKENERLWAALAGRATA